MYKIYQKNVCLKIPLFGKVTISFGANKHETEEKEMDCLVILSYTTIKLRDNGVVANSCKYDCIELLKVWTQTFCRNKFPY